MHPRADRLQRRARTYIANGQWAPARENLGAALQLAPDDDECRLELSLVESRLGHYASARTHTLTACRAASASAALALPRLEALRSFHAHGEMRRLAMSIDINTIESPKQSADIALCLQSAGLVLLAQQFMRLALSAAPAGPVLRTQAALIDLAAGDVAAARHAAAAVCAGNAVVPIAHWLLARLHTDDADRRAHALQLDRLLKQCGQDAEAEAFLAYAMHYLLDRLGDVEPAWTALERACVAKRSVLHYDEAAEIALHQALMSEPHLASTSIDGAAEAPTPIFIVGMHRSGTSLLERILEGHPSVAAGGESYRLSAALFAATDYACRGVADLELLRRTRAIDGTSIGRDYLDAHAWLLDGRSHFTEKLPGNYRLVGLIQRLLPQARVLHLVRDPVDTCWSNLRELFSLDNAAYSYRQDELGRAHRRCQQLMTHWKAQTPERLLQVNYADLVQRPEATARTVLEFCGLGWHSECVRVESRHGPVRSASALQVREPIHARSLGRAAAYAHHLGPLRAALTVGPTLVEGD
jgi:tetratricopeptide (TPR) repeat protein